MMGLKNAIAALVLTSLSLAQAQDVATFNFLSRPDIIAPVLHVMNYDPTLVAPGYLFFTPNSPGLTNFSAGPYIYNNNGSVVWSGYKDLPAGLGAFNAQVCPYQGKPHLCFTQFEGPQGGGQGAVGSLSHVYDNTYTSVQTVMPSGKWNNIMLTQDLHEFNMIGPNGESALMTSYITFEQNNTFPACLNAPSTAFIKTGLFSEVSTDGTNKELFQWSSLDHVDPTETFVCPGELNAGGGANQDDGFDYFHINSVDKDTNGDYLVSGRHTSTLYKIAGLNNPDKLSPGSVVWKLGGKNGSFPTMDSKVPMAPNLNFSFQHHARWNPAINGVTVWDNANSNIINASSLASSGKSISITNNSATLIGIYISPDRQLDSSQGSHQLLPNGNHFQGLGSYPFMYEETTNGRLAFYARFGILPIQSYRAFRFEWTAQPPLTEMAMFGYSLQCNGTASYYASWNGATEVASWTIFGSSSQNGTFVKTASAKKSDLFETVASGPFQPFVYAVAADSAGQELGKTPVVKTFVPSAALAPTCNTQSCPLGTNYTSPDLQTACPTASNTTVARVNHVKRALVPFSSSTALHKVKLVTKTRTRHVPETSKTTGTLTTSHTALHERRSITKTRTRYVVETSKTIGPPTSSHTALHQRRAITKTRTRHVTKSTLTPTATPAHVMPGHRIVKPGVELMKQTKTKTKTKGPVVTKTRTRNGGPTTTAI